MKGIEDNIKKLVIFFSLCFFSLIIYLTYFELYISQGIISDSSNRRLMVKDNEVLRGAFLDRNGNEIVHSEYDKNGNQKRIYKNGEAYAHIIGYNSYVYGRTGVELAYNDVLQGNNVIYNVFGNMARSIFDGITGQGKRGNDVVLTIDSKVQEAAYKALGKDKGGVCAMDPKTGEIIALVSTPSFDPKTIDKEFDKLKSNESKPLINRAMSGYYPPGSVFKIITTASAIENIEGVQNNVFNCKGGIHFGSYVLKDYGGTAHGKISLNTGFKVSCNYTFGTLGMELGYEKLKETAEKFMFNKAIPIGDEFKTLQIKPGGFTIQDKGSMGQIAQNAIGQNGVTANPLNMALVTSAIANNGVMMKPYLISEIQNRYGSTVSKGKPQELTRAVSLETAEIIKGYMVDTVNSGTGKSVRISGITIGGKTGSAEVENGNEHSWFVAFAPAEDPKIAVAVIVENAGIGGGRAAQVAREVIKTYLSK